MLHLCIPWNCPEKVCCILKLANAAAPVPFLFPSFSLFYWLVRIFVPQVHCGVQVPSRNHIFIWNRAGRKQSTNEKEQRKLFLHIYLRAFHQLLQCGSGITKKYPSFLPVHCTACTDLSKLGGFCKVCPHKEPKATWYCNIFPKKGGKIILHTSNHPQRLWSHPSWPFHFCGWQRMKELLTEHHWCVLLPFILSFQKSCVGKTLLLLLLL